MRIVAALGGNALLERGESPDAGIQEAHVSSAVTALTPVLRHNQLLITHGNGPQVGVPAEDPDRDQVEQMKSHEPRSWRNRLHPPKPQFTALQRVMKRTGAPVRGSCRSRSLAHCPGRRACPHPDAKRPWDLRPCHYLGCHREDRWMATLVSASHAQRASGHARLARRVADPLDGRYSTEPGIGVDAGDAEIERWFLAATLFTTASRLRSRNAPSVFSATQAWHGSSRHGTYGWTASPPSWMKAATRVTPRGPQRGSRLCPGSSASVTTGGPP